MARASRRLLRRTQELGRTVGEPPAQPPSQAETWQEPPRLILVKLDDHLPAPTEDFDDPALVATTVNAKRARKTGTGNSRDQHYELDDQEDASGNGLITVVNRFPWVWEYKHAYIFVEQFNGEWIPQQPHFSIVVGKTSTAHGKGDTEAVNIYWHETTAGSEAIVTDETLSAYNRWADIDADKWVELQWRYNGWKLVNGEC